MSSSILRSRLGAAARCSRRPAVTRICTRGYPAAAVPQEERPLETPDDWTQFQLDRAEFKTLVDHFSNYGSTQTRDNTWQPHHSLHRPVAPTQLTLSTLLAAGAHLGHSKSLMNPNFIPYAYGVRAGVTVIDLDHTLPLLRRAAKLVRSVAANDGTIVFVGTRPDLRSAVRKAASRMEEQGFHVADRWLPGTLTNKVQMFGAQAVLKQRVVPDLVVFLNPLQNMPAIRECAMEHVPTIGIVDSNVDPRIVMYPIPANDESTRTAELIAGVLSVAGREGVALRKEEDLKRQRRAERMAARQRDYERVAVE
ncbi:unnamed protein product [Somion occarium]|uniref:Ribosomal protein S2 n=1 Tax=Somion occarium TaxID=3059160 RepID=A0ABP1DB04_9APHY